MSYTLHTIDAPGLDAVESEHGVTFERRGDSYREWGEVPQDGDSLHAYIVVSTMEQALTLAGSLNIRALPSDLSTAEDWSESVDLPGFTESEMHFSYWDIFPRDQEEHGVRPANEIELLYRSESGEIYTQPLTDITESGTLTDPDTGEDMELIGYRTV